MTHQEKPRHTQVLPQKFHVVEQAAEGYPFTLRGGAGPSAAALVEADDSERVSQRWRVGGFKVVRVVPGAPVEE
jgi:hypothetical protein